MWWFGGGGGLRPEMLDKLLQGFDCGGRDSNLLDVNLTYF